MSFHAQSPPASLYVMEEQHDASHNEIRSYQCNSVVLHELDYGVHDRLADPLECTCGTRARRFMF